MVRTGRRHEPVSTKKPTTYAASSRIQGLSLKALLQDVHAVVILSNTEIQKAIDDGRLEILPEPQPRQPTPGDSRPCPYDTTSVDLRLGDTISIPPTKGPFAYDLRKGGLASFLSKNCEHIKIDSHGYSLEPNTFALGKTLEHIKLPIGSGRQSLAGRIEGKSSFARCGLLVHFTAPTVHADWDGTLTLEMKNLGNCAIILYPEMPICQLILEEVLGQIQTLVSSTARLLHQEQVDASPDAFSDYERLSTPIITRLVAK